MTDIPNRRDFLQTTGAVTAGALTLAGCSMLESSTLTLSATSLPGLPTGKYQAWAVFDNGDKIPVGYRSSLDNTEQYEFQTSSDIESATQIEITVEPDEDEEDTHSGVVVMDGRLNEQQIADLSFPVDLTQVKGAYTIMTTTNGEEKGTNGVWFLEIPNESTPSAAPPGSAPPRATLDLPELPMGWVYEGWVNLPNHTPVTTGRFRNPALPDYYDGFSGEQGIPPRPGEDFLHKTDRAPTNVQFPIDLTAQETRVVVSVEPDMDAMVGDNGGSYSAGRDIAGLAQPFSIQPLAGMVPDDATANTLYQLERNPDSLPNGTAQLE